jgi:hypothetical protein
MVSASKSRSPGSGIAGLGNPKNKGIVVEGVAHSLVQVICIGTRGNRSQVFEHNMGIRGSGEFPIDRNGRAVGPLQIYRGNGNGQAVEFCKGQNFDTGSVTLIRSPGRGSWISVPGYESVLPTYYF